MIFIGLLVRKKPITKYLIFYLVYLLIGVVILTIYYISAKIEYALTGYIFLVPLLFRSGKLYLEGMQLNLTYDNYEFYVTILDKFNNGEYEKEIIKFVSYSPIETKNILFLPYSNGFIITTKKKDMLKTINKSQFKIIKHKYGGKLVKGKYQMDDIIEKFEIQRKEFDKLNKALYEYNMT